MHYIRKYEQKLTKSAKKQLKINNYIDILINEYVTIYGKKTVKSLGVGLYKKKHEFREKK